MLVSALEGHRLWAESYDTAPNPLLALERRLVEDLLGGSTPARVLDVACGTGRWTTWFADTGSDVYGIDVCQAMLEQVPARVHGRFALGRADELPFASGTADLTICSFAAGYFSDLDRSFAEIARVTSDGGRVIVADLHPMAAAMGWKRSFRAAGQVYEMEHFSYTLVDFIGGAERAGLHLAAEIHAHFGQPERAIFERAGKAERFEQLTGIPAIWAGSWRKP
jgi:malonyl-CoA O-methyltransferase